MPVCLHMYMLHKAATASGGGRHSQAEWHRSSKGPLGQYGVNRPNKVGDYVSAEEPWKQKTPKSYHCHSTGSVDTQTHTWGGGGGTVGFRAVQRVEVEWWGFFLLTSKKRGG